MNDLEQVFRSGLAELADEADTSPAVSAQVVQRARSGVVRRRRSAVAVVGAAAAVVVVAAGLAVVLGEEKGGDEAGQPKPSLSAPELAPQVPGGYRPEFWHDVAVYVPATWGWGSAPTAVASGDALLCGGGQVVQADGSRREAPALPYVGRPFMLSDACDARWAQERPQAPYVWLGGDVPAGTVDLGGGWVRETIEVGDVTVSVASDDEALRTSILASAHQVAGDCEPRLGNPPYAAGSTDPDFVPNSMTVCAYVPTKDHLDYDLVYEQDLSMGPAKYLVAAVDDAPSLGTASCFGASGGDWALLRLRGSGGTFRDYAVDMSCPSISDPTGTQHPLNTETVTPWAVGGMNAVLHSHPLVQVPGRFIPPLG
jgi:hypothetical protein